VVGVGGFTVYLITQTAIRCLININIQEGGDLHIELCVLMVSVQLVRESLQLLWSTGQDENKLSFTCWNQWRGLWITLSSTMRSKPSVKKLAIVRDGEPKAIQFGFIKLATKDGISQDMGEVSGYSLQNSY
jgi:hypothetical protein